MEEKYEEDKKDKDENAKKRYEESIQSCENHQEEVNNRKKDVEKDLGGIKRQEEALVKLKEDCSQYISQ